MAAKTSKQTTDTMHFTFSDTIAGYVSSALTQDGRFELRTSDGRLFELRLTSTTYAEVLRNLGEPFQDPGAPLADLLVPGRYLFAYGIFYHEAEGFLFEAKHLILLGRQLQDYRFEAADWWVKQIAALAQFYFTAQFPDGVIDYDHYLTHLTLEGQKLNSACQETDTISRMIYGFASAYMLTGEERYLQAAQKGTEYLREHMRVLDEDEEIVYWYHAMDVQNGRRRKLFSSQFGDDYNALPAYEQIYALAGPVQTYRITGDPQILRDAQMTINLFDKYYRDPVKGGFFSHLDPVTLDPHVASLGQDRARKNWNSVGDHAPAYLINLWLATGEQAYADFLVETANTIVEHFPDDEHSPFVQERFDEDWNADTTWGWQQNRAVVGHNLKIAWNLMRIHHLRPNEHYTSLARKIAQVMPQVGMDVQRGGWYDVVERVREEGQDWHRYVWHDRKAWWQQEQAILAYLILFGSLKDPEHQRLARESAAFYNAFFPDQDNGGVYFNVLANGIPYLTGTERLKGSHSMSGYHSFELCYLAAVYTNLLIKKEPMDFYFKPQLGVLKDNLLRVQPDILPKGSVRIGDVWINGEPYSDFDAEEMTIRLPDRSREHPLKLRPSWAGNASELTQEQQECKVRVRLVPAERVFDAVLDRSNGTVQLTLSGKLTQGQTGLFQEQLNKIVEAQPKRVVLRMEGLEKMSKESARALSFASEKLSLEESIYVVGANPDVKMALQSVEIWEELNTEQPADL